MSYFTGHEEDSGFYSKNSAPMALLLLGLAGTVFAAYILLG